MLGLVASLVLAGCGGGGDGGGGSPIPPFTPGVTTGNPAITVTTIAGSRLAGSGDAVGTAATFSQPWGLVKVGTSIYATDSLNNTIRKIDTVTGSVTTFAGTASALGGTGDGVGPAAGFISPAGITSDGTSLYVAELYAGKIRKIDIASRAVTTLPASSNLVFPSAITTDGTSLYLTDSGDFFVARIVIATGAYSVLAGTPGLGGTTDGTGAAARFMTPQGITAVGGNLYVTDGNRIRKIVIATGVVSTLAGTPGAGCTDGVGAAAAFDSLVGISNDGTNLYVADMYCQAIRQVVIATGAVTTLAGAMAERGHADGTGATGRFNNPTDVIVDGATRYVADSGNNTIRKLQ